MRRFIMIDYAIGNGYNCSCCSSWEYTTEQLRTDAHENAILAVTKNFVNKLKLNENTELTNIRELNHLFDETEWNEEIRNRISKNAERIVELRNLIEVSNGVIETYKEELNNLFGWLGSELAINLKKFEEGFITPFGFEQTNAEVNKKYEDKHDVYIARLKGAKADRENYAAELKGLENGL